MRLNHIVAVSKNGVIGSSGQLPWHIGEDLKHFKKITYGHPIIMGRRTYESIGCVLPGRLNIVVSSTQSFKNGGIVTVPSIDKAIELAASTLGPKQDDDIFIIGGGKVYKQTLPLVDQIYLTRVHQDIDGDTFYEGPDPNMFSCVEKVDCEGTPNFSFCLYRRLK